MISIDSTDFAINEPTPFDKSWYSHKFQGPSLKYEIGISIKVPKLVWATGPWPCGPYSDLRIFRETLETQLLVDKFFIADSGYSDERCIQPPGQDHYQYRLMSLIRASYETCNKCLKQFGVLKQKFRNDLPLHHYCFSQC